MNHGVSGLTSHKLSPMMVAWQRTRRGALMIFHRKLGEQRFARYAVVRFDPNGVIPANC
jgi:hypothetical protein